MSLDPDEERIVWTPTEGTITFPSAQLQAFLTAGWEVYGTQEVDNSSMGETERRKALTLLRRTKESR